MNRLCRVVILTITFLYTTNVGFSTNSFIMNEPPPTSFMNDVLTYIQSVYPSDWLSSLVINDDNIGLEIIHPANRETYLSIDIFPEQLLIGVLAEANREVPFDLGGFHFDFTPDQMSEIHTFFDNHHQTGVAQ